MHPDRQHLTVIDDEAAPVTGFTYRALADAARVTAQALIERDVTPGDRIALMLPTSRDFFVAFFAILYAGARRRSPIYPPMRLIAAGGAPSPSGRHPAQRRGARMLITVPEARGVSRAASRRKSTSLTAVASVAEPFALEASLRDCRCVARDNRPRSFNTPRAAPGDPKGVVLNHANLLWPMSAPWARRWRRPPSDVFCQLATALSRHGADRGVARMPLYFRDAPLYVMSPLSFLMRPESWLWAIHRYRATLSAAPNFAFELCLNKIGDRRALKGSTCLRCAWSLNGAEPVSVPTQCAASPSGSAHCGFRAGRHGAGLWPCRELGGPCLSAARAARP